MSKGIVELLGKDLNRLNMDDYGESFARQVILAAQKQHVALKDIPELKYADLDQDGKIGEKEIATLIQTAHENRTGDKFKTVSSGTGRRDGHAVLNPDYDPSISKADIHAMTDGKVVENARKHFHYTSKLEGLSQAVDKETLNGLKHLQGGTDVNENSRESASSVRGNAVKHNAPTR